jgi:hypothetical protein
MTIKQALKNLQIKFSQSNLGFKSRWGFVRVKTCSRESDHYLFLDCLSDKFTTDKFIFSTFPRMGLTFKIELSIFH